MRAGGAGPAAASGGARGVGPRGAGLHRGAPERVRARHVVARTGEVVGDLTGVVGGAAHRPLGVVVGATQQRDDPRLLAGEVEDAEAAAGVDVDGDLVAGAVRVGVGADRGVAVVHGHVGPRVWGWVRRPAVRRCAGRAVIAGAWGARDRRRAVRYRPGISKCAIPAASAIR